MHKNSALCESYMRPFWVFNAMQPNVWGQNAVTTAAAAVRFSLVEHQQPPVSRPLKNVQCQIIIIIIIIFYSPAQHKTDENNSRW